MIDYSAPCSATVQVTGDTFEDIKTALGEVCRLAELGILAGADSNESSGFLYEPGLNRQVVIHDDELDGLLQIIMTFDAAKKHSHLCYRLRQRIEARLHSIQT